MLYIYLLLLWIAYFISKNKPNLNRKFLIGFSLILIVFSFIRYGYGTDYFSYEYLYTQFNPRNFGVGEKIEFGYKLLMSAFKLFNVPFSIFAGFISTITIILTTKWIDDVSEDNLLSYIIYFSLFATVWFFSAFRQGIVLAVGLNIFFNSKIKIKPKYQLLITLILSTIHISALFFILIIIFDRIEWKRKYNLYLMAFCLIMTFFPYQKILQLVDFIPSVDILLRNYLSASINLFNFASLVRAFFFALHYLFYDSVAETREKQRLFNLVQVGISIYFLLKFSELVAARFTIFTFVIIVITVADIFNYIMKTYFKKLSIILTLIMVGITYLFLNKEVSAYFEQSGLSQEYEKYHLFTTFNKNPYAFNSKDAFRVSVSSYCSLDREVFIENSKNIKIEPYSNSLTYVLVKDHTTGKYGVLNSNGNWLIEPTFDNNGEINGSILVFNKQGLIFDEYEYYDLSDQNRTQEELQEALDYEKLESYKNTHIKQAETDIQYEDLNDKVKEIVPIQKRVSAPTVVHMSFRNMEYYLLKFYYYGDAHYIYMNMDLNPISPYIHRYANKLDVDNIIKTNTYCGRVFINNEGKIIWYE